MTTRDETLVRCFEATFPELDTDAIATASADTVEGWDSLGTLTLMAVLEEEFGIEIAIEELPNLRSYSDVRDFLRREDHLP